MKNIFKYALSVLCMVLLSAVTTGYAMGAGVAPTEGTAGEANQDGTVVTDLPDGGGHIVEGARTMTGDQKVIKDNEWFVKQVNKAIVEMKFVGTPIDQILRNSTVNKSDSIVVKYYSVGQRPLKTTIDLGTATAWSTASSGNPAALDLKDPNCVGEMDTLLIIKSDGNFYMSPTKPAEPLMLRVHAIDASTNKPMVYAVNGFKSSTDKSTVGFCIPADAITNGYTVIRMGRAAAEKDVTTGAYYQLPEPTEQYCQRFIMEVEESVYTRFSKTELDWTFTRMEKMAMEDMRIGMEASGLFGVKSQHTVNRQGVVYTTGGIWYMAGKNLTLGHWEYVLNQDGTKKTADGYYVKQYVITEDELVDFVAAINLNAGNSSRKKLVFVDDDIYAALCKVKTNNRIRLLEKVDNFMNLGLDFESYTSMGTTLMFYRHDLFKAWGFAKKAFVLDPEYLDKWVFSNWSREEYDLKKLFVRNSNAVTMEEFSCWTLAFPNAHARVSAPAYVAEEVPATTAETV